MKNLKRQDRNGTRTSEELRRRYNLNQIELTSDEVEYLKQFLVVDSYLSTTSEHAIQNATVTKALNTKASIESLGAKVDKEEGKGLSTNDFTTTLLNKLNGIAENAKDNVIESISVNGTPQTVTNKNVNLQIEASGGGSNITIKRW